MRPTVTTVAVTLSDGRTLTFDATQLEGLFWADRTVTQMLAPFYAGFSIDLTPADLAEAPAALPVLGGEGSVPLTPALVGELWNAPDPSGALPALMKKSGRCMAIPCY